MDGHALINQDQSEGARLQFICKHYICKVKTDSQENLKSLQVKRPIFSVVYEAKGMKFCTQVPTTFVHKLLVLDFHVFA